MHLSPEYWGEQYAFFISFLSFWLSPYKNLRALGYWKLPYLGKKILCSLLPLPGRHHYYVLECPFPWNIDSISQFFKGHLRHQFLLNLYFRFKKKMVTRAEDVVRSPLPSNAWKSKFKPTIIKQNQNIPDVPNTVWFSIFHFRKHVPKAVCHWIRDSFESLSEIFSTGNINTYLKKSFMLLFHIPSI